MHDQHRRLNKADHLHVTAGVHATVNRKCGPFSEHVHHNLGRCNCKQL